jgi:hypothetical protein
MECVMSGTSDITLVQYPMRRDGLLQKLATS